MTFQCLDCDEHFDEPGHKVDRELADYGIGREWIVVWEGDCCPVCGHEHFRELEDGEEIDTYHQWDTEGCHYGP
jgi:hypothetical protein